MKTRGLTREQVMNDVLLAAQPTKRFVTPEEVAALALFLCRDEARVDHRRQSQHGRRLDCRLGCRRCAALLSSLSLSPAAGCSVIEQPAGMIPHWTTAWREVATARRPRPAARLAHDLRRRALDAARKSGHAAEIAREGALLDPDAALGRPAIPNGMYRCRVIKLGAKAAGQSRLCRLSRPSPAGSAPSASSSGSTKLTGSQRYVGLIFPGDAIRQVFLGTLVLGDETRAHAIWPGRDRATSPAMSSGSAPTAGGW